MQRECNSDTDQSKQSLSPKFLMESSEFSFGDDMASLRRQRPLKPHRKSRSNSAPRAMSDTCSWRGYGMSGYCVPDIRRTPAMYIEQDIIHRQRQEIQLLMEELGNRDQELNDLVMSHQKQVKAWECDSEKLRSLQSRLTHCEDELKTKEEQLRKSLLEMAHLSEQRETDALELNKTQGEMIKLTERIMENSVYIKEMESQNQKMKILTRELTHVRQNYSAREQELLALLKEKDIQLSEKQEEKKKIVDHLKYLEHQCRQLGEKNNNMTEETVNWRKKYSHMKEEVERLHGDCKKKEENIQKMTQQLHESLQQAIALQKALFTSCEREKCKEEVMYSLRKQHKRTMQELQNIRELYDRLSQDMSGNNLSVTDKEAAIEGKKKEALESVEEEGRKQKDGKTVEDVDKLCPEGRQKFNTNTRSQMMSLVENAEMRDSRNKSNVPLGSTSSKLMQSQTSPRKQEGQGTQDVYCRTAGMKQHNEDHGFSASVNCKLSPLHYSECHSDRMCHEANTEISHKDSRHTETNNMLQEVNKSHPDGKSSSRNILENSCLPKRSGPDDNQALASPFLEVCLTQKHLFMKTGNFSSQEELSKEIALHSEGYGGSMSTDEEERRSTSSSCGESEIKSADNQLSEKLFPQSRGKNNISDKNQRQDQDNLEGDFQNSNNKVGLKVLNPQEQETSLSGQPCLQCLAIGATSCDCYRIHKSSAPSAKRTSFVFEPDMSFPYFEKEMSTKPAKVSFTKVRSQLGKELSLKDSHFHESGEYQAAGKLGIHSSMNKFSDPSNHQTNKWINFCVPPFESLNGPTQTYKPSYGDLPDEVSIYLACQRPVRREMYYNNNRCHGYSQKDNCCIDSIKSHHGLVDQNLIGQSKGNNCNNFSLNNCRSNHSGCSELSGSNTCLHEVNCSNSGENPQDFNTEPMKKTCLSQVNSSNSGEDPHDFGKTSKTNAYLHEPACNKSEEDQKFYSQKVNIFSCSEVNESNNAVGKSNNNRQSGTGEVTRSSSGVSHNNLDKPFAANNNILRYNQDSEYVVTVLQDKTQLPDDRSKVVVDKQSKTILEYLGYGDMFMCSNKEGKGTAEVHGKTEQWGQEPELPSEKKTVSERRLYFLQKANSEKSRKAINESEVKSYFCPEETDSESEVSRDREPGQMSVMTANMLNVTAYSPVPFPQRSPQVPSIRSSLKYPWGNDFSGEIQSCQNAVPQNRSRKNLASSKEKSGNMSLNQIRNHRLGKSSYNGNTLWQSQDGIGSELNNGNTRATLSKERTSIAPQTSELETEKLSNLSCKKETGLAESSSEMISISTLSSSQERTERSGKLVNQNRSGIKIVSYQERNDITTSASHKRSSITRERSEKSDKPRGKSGSDMSSNHEKSDLITDQETSNLTNCFTQEISKKFSELNHKNRFKDPKENSDHISSGVLLNKRQEHSARHRGHDHFCSDDASSIENASQRSYKIPSALVNSFSSYKSFNRLSLSKTVNYRTDMSSEASNESGNTNNTNSNNNNCKNNTNFNNNTISNGNTNNSNNSCQGMWHPDLCSCHFGYGNNCQGLWHPDICSYRFSYD